MEITTNAIEVLQKMLESEKTPRSGIRISILPGCCSPKPLFSVAVKAEEGDKIMSIDAVDFFIDKSTEKVLSGYIIDYSSNGFKLDFLLPDGRCCR